MKFSQAMACVVLLAGVALGEAPATEPSGVAGDGPSPAQLIKKLKADVAEKAALLKVAYFNFNSPVKETPSTFAFLTGDDGLMLNSLIDRLHKAKNDNDIKAVLINLAVPQMNLSQASELRDVLAEFKGAGKKVFIYADTYDTAGYTLASGASDICMLEGGEIELPGVGFETQYLKNLFDKVGVKADFVQIGQYKGAQEPYTRADASDEFKGELNKLTDALYAEIVSGISRNRNLTKDEVKSIIDDTMINGPDAKKRGLVDHLLDQDGLRDLIGTAIGGKIDIVKDYGEVDKPQIDPSNIFSLLQALSKKPPVSDKPGIALVPASGVIVDGEGEASFFGGGGGVGSEKFRRTFRSLDRDDSIKAVVLRIDSPGGSALASEVMWQSLRRLAKDKPVVISVGGMAASGGYYLASAADTIFADPTAIVGSIGVVGGKFVTKDLFDKIGITNEPFMRGKNAGLYSSNQPWTDEQHTLITKWMTDTYNQFTTRVMTTRTGKIKDIDQVARGRIFLAGQAKELGMVDEIGGVQAAIEFAAGKAKLEPGAYEVRLMPAPKTLSDYLAGNSAESKTDVTPKMELAVDSVLRMLPPSQRDATLQQLQMMQLMQEHPVILAMPFTLTAK